MTAIEATVDHSQSVTAKTAAFGRGLSALGAAFLTFDASVKLLALSIAADTTAKLGWPVELMPAIGAIEIVCLIAYLVPRTAFIGAILWTGYLGGAVATHVRVGNPAFETLFPIFVAAILWTGLWLRDARVRALTA